MTMAVEVVRPDARTIEAANASMSRAELLLAEAEAARIIDSITAQEAADLRNTINADEKASEAARTALVKPLNDHVKWINDQFRPASTLRQKALDILRRTLAAWDDKQRQEREEAERRLREEQAREQRRLEAEAAEAEARGNIDQADEFSARAETVAMAPTNLPPPETPAGISYRTTYRAEVIDLGELLLAVLEGKVPPGAVVPDMRYINAAARSLKGGVHWPGVRWIAERTVATSSR